MDLVRLLFPLALGRRLPTTRGALKVLGLDATVTVRRDHYDIVYIALRRYAAVVATWGRSTDRLVVRGGGPEYAVSPAPDS